MIYWKRLVHWKRTPREAAKRRSGGAAERYTAKRALCVQTRRTALQVGNPHKLVITFKHQTQRPDDLEDQLHADLISSLVRGEWYALTGTIDYQSIIRDAENKLNIRNEEILQKEIDVQRLNLKKGSSLRN